VSRPSDLVIAPTRRQIGAKKSAIGRFVCKAAHCTEAEVNCSRRELT